tara:strand:- start:187 stop:465 length:279 start_codon:yes stop_codon:yes gene_type:complete
MNSSNFNEDVKRGYIDYKRYVRNKLLEYSDKYVVFNDYNPTNINKDDVITYRQELRDYLNILEQIDDYYLLYSCNYPIAPYSINMEELIRPK